MSQRYQGPKRPCLRIEKLENRLALAVGDLDISFGNAGTLRDSITQARASNESAVEVLPRGDGGFYVAGDVSNGRGFSGIVWSFKNDGSLDASFGTQGSARVALGSGWEHLVDMARQPDGKLVVAGYARDLRIQSRSVLVLSRLNANGTIDTSFGDSGQVYTDFQFHVGPSAIVVRPSGEILVLAAEFDSVHLVQYRPDGSLDANFAGDGRTDYPLVDNEPGDLLLLPDGSAIVSTAWKVSEGNYGARVLKYLPGGTLDTNFGTNGVFDIPLASQIKNNSYRLPLRLALTNDGDILLAGTKRVDEVHDYLVTKFSTSGILNDSFGSNGVASVPIQGGFGTALHDIEVKPGGSIVITGSQFRYGATDNGTQNIFLTAAGGLDATSGNQGRAALGDPSAHYGATALVGNRLILAGTRSGVSTDLQLLGITATGTLDDAFGIQGRVIVNSETAWTNSTIQDVIQLPDGKLLGAMTSFQYKGATNLEIFLTRYLPSGAADTSYGNSGKQSIVDVLQGVGPYFERTSQGTFLVVQNGTALQIAKLTADGYIDASFGSNGWLRWQFSSVLSSLQNVLMTDNAIYVSGLGGARFENGFWVQDYAIAKLDLAGNRINDFGSAGLVELPMRNQVAGSHIALRAQSSDQILVLLANQPSDPFFAVSLMRIDANGVVDQRFGTDGRRVTSLTTGGALDRSRDVQVLADGGFVVMGTRSDANLNAQIRVERYDRDGTLVPSFGNSGIVEIPVDWPTQEPFNLAVDSSGRILVSSAIVDKNSTKTAITRFLPNGMLDAAFGQNGLSTFAFDRFNEGFPALRIVEHDDIIIGGYEVQAAATQGVIARIVGDGPEPSSWHNDWLAEDVNGDRLVSPIDVLLVINRLNTQIDAELPAKPVDAIFADVNGDGFASAMDALLIINRLNQPGNAEGETSIEAVLTPSVGQESDMEAAWLPDIDRDRRLRGRLR